MNRLCFKGEDRDVQYAYGTIHDFFGDFGFTEAKLAISAMLKAATGSKVWKKGAPYSLVFFMEKLNGLCSAAFTVINNNATRAIAIANIYSPVENGHPDMSLRQYYVSDNQFSTVWNSFPRNLNAREYCNPYRALAKFCRYQTENGWQEIVKGCTEYALSKSSLQDGYPEYDPLAIRLHLLKLIEACHLLEVRCSMEQKDDQNNKTQNI